MEKIYFENPEDALSKLKELKVLSKTKKIDDLTKIKYKEISQNNICEFKCKVLGYNIKPTNGQCLSRFYENLIVEVNGDMFNINVEELIAMQKKDYGSKNQID